MTCLMALLQAPKWLLSAATVRERQNNTPIFISGMTDTRGVLSWIGASCQSGLTVQIKETKLMFVL
jgi:hypothetical protein